MDIYTVANMLGDTVGVVEKHYAKFTNSLRESARQIMFNESEFNFDYDGEKKDDVAAGPVSRILSAGLLLRDDHSSGPRIAGRL